MYSNLHKGFWDLHLQNVVAITIAVIFKWVLCKE